MSAWRANGNLSSQLIRNLVSVENTLYPLRPLGTIANYRARSKASLKCTLDDDPLDGQCCGAQLKALLPKIMGAGTHYVASDSERLRIRITNGLAGLFTLTTSSYAPVLYLTGMNRLNWAIALGTCVYASVPFLNAWGRTLLSRIVLISNALFIVAFFSMMLGKQTGVYYLFIAFAALAFAVFELKDRLALGFTIGSSLVLLCLCEVHEQIYGSHSPFTEAVARYFSYSLFLLTYAIIIAIVYGFYVLNWRAETAIRAAKDQQDGDYFLTNLIIQPLFKNYNRSEVIQTEFFVRQKKTFSFKGRPAELGGDMNVTGNLRLRGQRYTMFINSDAMGKSMQGAGGAIVLGTVVNAILARSASNKRNLQISPRDWMLETHAELQKVFETFDGSMLISCAFGLISDEGRMLYFNADHPRTVLYRQNVASFLPGDSPNLKIGIPLRNEVNIIEFDLQPGDVLIAGTDGRDDLELRANAQANETNRSINDDETLFLRIVENADGDLLRIYQNLTQVGELIDDLSMIRIAYNGVGSFTRQKPDMERYRRLVRLRLYKQALEELEQRADDESREQICLRAACLERTGYGNAALALLAKHHKLVAEYKPALLLQAFIQLRAGDLEVAEEILQRLRAQDPHNRAAERLHERLRRIAHSRAAAG